MSYQGCLTIDGEHENNDGMAIIAKSTAEVVAEQIILVNRYI
jgi:hypothetical protein